MVAWGESVISNVILKYVIVLKKNLAELDLGNEDSDIITAVDSEKVENARFVKLQIFLRGYRTLEVQKPSGEKLTVELEQNINDWMWENDRSEERRVGKECRSRWSRYH